MFDVIIAASGESTRFGSAKNKLLYPLNEYTVLENSVRPFLSVDGLEKLIIATSQGLFDEITKIAQRLDSRISVCIGGETRTATVKNALRSVSAEYVLIHDGARPFVTPEIILEVLNAARKVGAAVPTVQIEDSVTNLSDGYSPVDRSNLCAVQTPQGFMTEYIKNAYDNVTDAYTDDVSVYLTSYSEISPVQGSKHNRKITTADDLFVADCRVGVGFDTHRLTAGRKLILGGVEIPHDKGLIGHSDADVLTHAVMDALLSAAGKRDIGFYFPDTDSRFKGADSVLLLGEVMKMLYADGYAVKNVSVTVLAEKPKLMQYIPKMIVRLATALSVNSSCVAVLATTTEGVGLVGMEEAISAIATASIIRR